MNVKIYGKMGCVGCDKAKALLESKGLGYEYVDVMKTPTAQDLFKTNGWRSVPQIFVDGVHVGGFEQFEKSFG